MNGERNRMQCSRRCICSVYLWHLSATTCICSAYLPPIVVLTGHQSMLNAAIKIFIWICTFQKNWSAIYSCCPISCTALLQKKRSHLCTVLVASRHLLHFFKTIDLLCAVVARPHVLLFYKRNDHIYEPVAPHHFLHCFKRNNLLYDCFTSFSALFQKKQSSMQLPHIIRP